MVYIGAFEANPKVWCIKISFFFSHDQRVNQPNYETIIVIWLWKGIVVNIF